MSELNPFNTKNETRNQCQQIKEYLEAGNTLSTFDAYRLFNITCLAQRVHDLRHRYGYNISTTNVTHNGKRFAVYSWDESNPKQDLQPNRTTSKAVKGVANHA